MHLNYSLLVITVLAIGVILRIQPSLYREIPKALIFSHQEFIKHIKDIFNEKKFTVN
jgi:hypothetical protein